MGEVNEVPDAGDVCHGIEVIEIEHDIHALVGEMGRGYRSFGYVLSMDGFSVLIDATDVRFLSRLAEFPPPRHLLLTHRHTRLHEADYEERYDLGIYLHPIDADWVRDGPSQGTRSPSRYRDPMSEPALRDLGFRFLHVPGHTAGFTMIIWDRHDGILFSGDAVIGPKPGQPRQLYYPPIAVSDDDGQLRRSLAALEPPRVRHILPFHGEPLHDLDEAEMAAMWSTLIAG